MDAGAEKRLSNAGSRQSFTEEVEQMLAPYGMVKRIQLLVGKEYPRPEVSCFVEMETPQQAMAAQDGLKMQLLGSNYLYLSVTIMAGFMERE